MNNPCMIAFYHPKLKKLVFLANTVDIKNFCYTNNPYIPGTLNIEKAKIFKTIDDAKSLIYLLRYHRREFLQVVPIIKQLNSSNLNFSEKPCIEEYDISDFYIENSY